MTNNDLCRHELSRDICIRCMREENARLNAELAEYKAANERAVVKAIEMWNCVDRLQIELKSCLEASVHE